MTRTLTALLTLALALGATSTAHAEDPQIAQRTALEAQTIAFCQSLATIPSTSDGCAAQAPAIEALVDEHLEALEHNALKHSDRVAMACRAALANEIPRLEACANESPPVAAALGRVNAFAAREPSPLFAGPLPSEREAILALCGRIASTVGEHGDDCAAATTALGELTRAPMAGFMSERLVEREKDLVLSCFATFEPHLETFNACSRKTEDFDAAIREVLGEL